MDTGEHKRTELTDEELEKLAALAERGVLAVVAELIKQPGNLQAIASLTADADQLIAKTK